MSDTSYSANTDSGGTTDTSLQDMINANNARVNAINAAPNAVTGVNIGGISMSTTSMINILAIGAVILGAVYLFNDNR